MERFEGLDTVGVCQMHARSRSPATLFARELCSSITFWVDRLPQLKFKMGKRLRGLNVGHERSVELVCRLSPMVWLHSMS